MIKRIGVKQAGKIYISMNILTVIVHLLVIFGMIPYTWTNGGRSATYETARQISLNSIPYFVVLTGIVLVSSGFVKVKWNSVTKTIISILLWINVAYTFLGLIFQFLGTPFEKVVMSLVCITCIIMGIRLAIEKRQ